MDDLRMPGVQTSDWASKVSPQGELRSSRVGQIAAEEGVSTNSDARSFSQWMSSALNQTNSDQLHADRAIQELVAGKTKNVHEAMLAIEKADLSFKLMMQVRNKLLDAYREIMRMQV